MTMVATPGVVGILQSTVPGAATTFTVDSAYAAYLAGQLVGGAWTYVRSRVGRSVEVMQITGISGQLVTAIRGLDNTTALTLTVGGELEFTMGASAVQDMINAAALAPALVLTSDDASVVITAGAPGTFDLSAQPVVQITSNNGSLLVTSSGPLASDISVNASTIGCCSS